MTFVVPGATLKIVPNRKAGIRKPTLGLVLHVQAGLNSPFGWFSNPASEDSSTWWVAKDGRIEQYIDPDTDHAWAQAAGNVDFHSVETEGQPSEPLTSAQMDALAALYLAGHDRWGWPMQLSESPTQPGFGWHGMGGADWGGHLGCPGSLRKLQRATILGRAMALRAAVTPVVGSIPKPVVKAVVVPRFPLRLGHWFGVNDGTIFSHSGVNNTDQSFIRAIQTRVGAQPVDGRFGEVTQSKVLVFQKAQHLALDGRVGPITWAALYKN